MPLLLRVAMALGGVFGVFGTAVGLWALLGVVGGGGSFRIDEASVSRADLLAVAVPFLALYISACVTAGAAAWALWKRRSRSRPLLTLLLAEFVVGDAAMLAFLRRTLEVGTAEMASSAFVFLVLVAAGLWYLFRKDSVVRYYASVGRMPVGVPTTHGTPS